MSELSAAPECVERALTDLENPLVTLASAGVLAGVGLTFRDGEERCGAEIFLDQDDVGEGEEADFSALRVLVSPEAEMALAIICQDSGLARKLVDRLLPRLSAETLDVAQIRWQTEVPEADVRTADAPEDERDEGDEEAWDEYDDEFESGR